MELQKLKLSVSCPNPDCKYNFWMKEDTEYNNGNYHFFKCVQCGTIVYIPRVISKIVISSTKDKEG